MRVLTDGVEKQESMTRDNVPVQVNAVIWYRVVKPDLAIIAVQNVRNAVVQVALTTLRNVIGQHSLDDVLKEREKLAALLKDRVDAMTEAWGVEIQNVEMKNVEIPASMQRAMAQEAEALREKRGRIIKAEAEMEAARKLREAADEIMNTPAALELRRMQMLTEIGAEQNTMTMVMMPSEFVEAARAIRRKKIDRQEPRHHFPPSLEGGSKKSSGAQRSREFFGEGSFPNICGLTPPRNLLLAVARRRFRPSLKGRAVTSTARRGYCCARVARRPAKPDSG